MGFGPGEFSGGSRSGSPRDDFLLIVQRRSTASIIWQTKAFFATFFGTLRVPILVEAQESQLGRDSRLLRQTLRFFHQGFVLISAIAHHCQCLFGTLKERMWFLVQGRRKGHWTRHAVAWCDPPHISPLPPLASAPLLPSPSMVAPPVPSVRIVPAARHRSTFAWRQKLVVLVLFSRTPVAFI